MGVRPPVFEEEVKGQFVSIERQSTRLDYVEGESWLKFNSLTTLYSATAQRLAEGETADSFKTRPSMRNDVRYTPTDCFETFPFPESTTNLETIGETYYNHRQAIMQTRQEGLTKTYNRFHDPAETSADIIKLRQLRVEMDYAVAQAYGWEDLNLAHGFHKTKQGLRYTISEPIRREILDRLLQLNFDRYAEEVAQGLHDKKKKGKGKRKKGKVSSGLGRK